MAGICSSGYESSSGSDNECECATEEQTSYSRSGCVDKETLLARKAREAKEELIIGMFKASTLLFFMVVLYFYGSTCCVCLWAVMVATLMLMIFAGMTRLWFVLLLSFFGTFWAGCQVGNHWISVNTGLRVR